MIHGQAQFRPSSLGVGEAWFWGTPKNGVVATFLGLSEPVRREAIKSSISPRLRLSKGPQTCPYLPPGYSMSAFLHTYDLPGVLSTHPPN
jgi:hypothetical protein